MKKLRKTINISQKVDSDLSARIAIAAKERRIPKSRLVREAIILYLNQKPSEVA